MDTKTQKPGDAPAAVAPAAIANGKPTLTETASPSMAASEPAATIQDVPDRLPALGDRVHLVTVRDGHAPATIMRLCGGMPVDLEYEDAAGKTQRMTRVPRDDSGAKHDSWHFAD